MRNYYKLLKYNLLSFLIIVFVIEIIFGGWFDKNNLGAYFKEHRIKKVSYKIRYNQKDYSYVYRRNFLGFRGAELNTNEIKAVFIGGSTADERWLPENFTIVGNLNRLLKKDNININIINAGIDGQSTVGYLVNFTHWFSKLEDFKPEYFIFYTGINDMWRDKFDKFDYSDGIAKLVEINKFDYFIDNLKSKSIFIDLIRKFKYKNKEKKEFIFLDHDEGIKKYPNSKALSYGSGSGYNYLSYKKALETENVKDLLEQEDKKINFYLNNIDELVKYSEEYGATPIFINQVMANGAHEKSLFALSIALMSHCKKKNYQCIDLATDFQGEQDYWYDGIHTTPRGSKIISEKIYSNLKKIININ